MTTDDPWAVLDKDVGAWDAELEIWPGPGAPGQRQRGRADNRRVGGWLIVDFRADSGFEGHGVYGWDAEAGRYTGVWVDGLGGGMARATGTWDAATRTMTYTAEASVGGQRRRYREQTTTIDADTLAYRHLVPMPDGSEHTLMTITYRRRR